MDVDPGAVLMTQWLRLRPWQASDIEPLHALNTDPEAMRRYPWTDDRERSQVSLRHYRAHFAEHGWGPWVIELEGEAPFVGVLGLSHVEVEAHFTPAVEVGWRIVPAYQGRGYATEAARAALKFGFETIGLREIIAFCTPDNRPSRRVVLYRLRAHEFAARDTER